MDPIPRRNLANKRRSGTWMSGGKATGAVGEAAQGEWQFELARLDGSLAEILFVSRWRERWEVSQRAAGKFQR